jgi:shikimate dehydrogenase
MNETKHAFVCGHPISHSRSPVIHGHWLKTYGLAGGYHAVDVAPENFHSFVTSLAAKGFSGGNVTIPHKEAACAIADSRETVAEIIGAANTLWLENGRLCATNTDAYGFAANLDEQLPGWDRRKTALVIGAGGASRAVIHTLIERGFTAIHVANRTEGRAQELADRFGDKVQPHSFSSMNEIVPDAELLINTTSLGMKGEGVIPLDMSKVRACHRHCLCTADYAFPERRQGAWTDNSRRPRHAAAPGRTRF